MLFYLNYAAYKKFSNFLLEIFNELFSIFW